jgi:alkanesulfonate monooxygenase SsuD/methylene tetrahydromethanopterin reductase-like flavin-dependent oxidoreductase (luciferase family)
VPTSVYTVTPESYASDGRLCPDFRRVAAKTARATERAGWTGMLVPQSFHEIDPWLVSGHLGSVTAGLIPLIGSRSALS